MSGPETELSSLLERFERQLEWLEALATVWPKLLRETSVRLLEKDIHAALADIERRERSKKDPRKGGGFKVPGGVK